MRSDHTYQCPQCRFKLSDGEKLVLQTTDIFGKQAWFFIKQHPRIYTARLNPKLQIKEASFFTYSCPQCQNNLVSNQYKNFIEIGLEVREASSFNLLFSPMDCEEMAYVLLENWTVKKDVVAMNPQVLKTMNESKEEVLEVAFAS